MHLILDALSRRKVSVNLVRAWLQNTPDTIGMTRISPVVTETRPDAAMGMVILAESHCSVHWTGKRIYLDVFSCQPFDWRLVVEMAVREFRLTEWRPTVLEERLDFTYTAVGDT